MYRTFTKTCFVNARQNSIFRETKIDRNKLQLCVRDKPFQSTRLI